MIATPLTSLAPLTVRRRHHARATLALALGLALAGCTGGDGGDGGASSETSGPEAPDAAAAAPTPEVLGDEPGATITGTPEPLPTVVSPSATLPSATLSAGDGSAGGSASGSGDPDVTYEVQIMGGRVSPAPDTVDLAPGQKLRIVVRSDRDTEIHAHGFEVDRPVPAKASVPFDLVGGAPGVYEVESHDPDLLLLEVAVG